MHVTRRQFLLAAGLAGLAVQAPGVFANPRGASTPVPVSRAIPSTGERLPAVGMGTWITFNVGNDPYLIEQRTNVLKTFFDLGGSVVDCSPMYGSSAEVLGQALDALKARDRVFAATKIWTGDESATRSEADSSRRRWGVERFDLLQVHNLLGWRGHLETLKAMKAAGEVRYVGITTSHGRRHSEFEQIMETQPLDFVQLTYNVLDREAEARLLPLAQERGIAVMVNRPFQGGALFRRFQSEPLPAWAGDVGVSTWAEYFLKFIISHPAVTCAIPATTRVEHMQENMAAMVGELPDERQRQRMVDYVRSL
ncbi:aldo/keto reductase [Marinobacter arenosus]|uniref:aldo/keto reductase n=1 Tax=Marinobacter arenosus TaxID=2856822 RepID=UPI001E2BEE6E|nr:aldo/keto reductase [Marinobacter arenosus]